MHEQPGAAPFVAVALAIGILCVMDALIKGLAEWVPLGQVVTLRYLFGALVALPFFVASQPKLSWRSVRANGVRAVIIAAAATCFFHAISTLPLAEALALSFLSPIFVALFGSSILAERASRSVLGAIVLGSAGVLVMLTPKFSAGLTGDLRTFSGVVAALLSAVLYALAMVLLRKQSAFDPVPVLVFLQAAIAALVTSPALVLGRTVPLDATSVALFAAVGILGTVGHLVMAWGYARAQAGRLGPLEYTAFVWAALLGYFLFGERLEPETLAGIALIVAACLLATANRRK